MILLKGLKSKQATQLVRANQQVHYKMYKAGIHWVTAGLSTIGGLFGLGMVAPATAAKAATQAGVAQQVADDAVTATQKQGTIPATSLASQRDLESASLTGSTTDQHSTATTSVTTSVTTSSESVTVTEQESASGKPTPTGSTAQATSVTSTTISTAATSTKPAPADAPSDSTTAVADGATPTTAASSTLTTTGSEVPSQTTQVVTPTTAAPATHQPVLQPDVWDLKLPTAMLSSWLPGFLNTTNKTPNQVGADDATKDLGDVLGGAYDNTFHMVTNAVGNTTNQMVNVITGGLLASKTPEPKIIRNIQKVSTIYQSYRDGKLVDNSQATPLWHDDNYNSLKLTGEDLAAYNQGYTHYLFNFAKGLSQWIDSIQDKATNPTTANQLIDDVTYNPNSMTGVTSSGQLGVAVTWATGENQGYAKDVLGYQSDGNVAAGKIAQAVETVTDYVKIIAPNIINGIAHQAMTDIRSLGGAINGDDYAPQTLSQAIQLNQNIATMVGNMGLTGLVSTSLFEDIYQGIRANAVTALENNWTIGENDALQQMLAEGDLTGAQNDDDPLYVNFVKDKGAQTAGDITNNLFNTAGKLSTMSQQAGFTWAYKVLGQVISIANTDALGGTGKPDLAAIVTQLQASGTISAAEANQILQGTQASHTITSGGRTTTYTRNSVGVQRVINEVYLAEYNAATAAVQDLTTNQTAPEQWVSQQQQNLTYQSPITKQWMPGMTTTLGIYEQLWGTMWSFAPGYLGMAAADQAVHQQQGPVSAPSQPWKVSSSITHAWADMLMFSGAMMTSPNVSQVQQALLDLGQRLAGQAYQRELTLANQAFNDGMALAHQQDAQSLDGSLPPVTQAGAYHGHDASNDGTGQVFLPQQSTVLDEWRGVVSVPVPGQIFQDGYQSQLETVTIYTKATGTSLFGPRFSNTSMSKLNNTKVNVLKGHADRLTRPSTDAKWRLVSAQAAPATVTFEYAPVPQETAVSSVNLQAVEGTYDGQPASQHLAGAQLQLQWADQSTKTIALQSDWVTVDQDQARVGDYQYQLSAKGIQVLLQQLQQGLPKTAAAPTLAQLTTAKGTVTLKPSATLIPRLTTHAVQVLAGQSVQPADMVTSVADALGNPQDPALVTGPVDQVSQLAPGTHQVELIFTDPTSGETAHQSATVTVISQEASTSMANVVASTASASLATNLSAFDSQSVQLAHQSEQSLSGWASEMAADSTSRFQDQSVSAALQSTVDANNQTFTVASVSNAQADDQSLSALGSALSSASTSTSISTAISLADASVQQAVQSADQVFNQASASNAQMDDQSLSTLGSTLTSIANSLADASVQQAVQSANQAFNQASASNAQADDQSLSALGSALNSASTSTSISTAMSLADASVQQAVQSANQVFNLASTSNEQADDQSLSALGSALSSASTSQSISIAMSLADASVQKAVQSANQVFNIASTSNAQADDQSLSALGSVLSSASTSTSISTAMSLANASVQQAVQSANQVFNLASTSNERADNQSLSALGSALTS
ncbi:KxYKxGKxW signal peptide domain-containing protein, partial [Levilactobacillus namurensis]